jgi:hypothetical protein
VGGSERGDTVMLVREGGISGRRTAQEEGERRRDAGSKPKRRTDVRRDAR